MTDFGRILDEWDGMRDRHSREGEDGTSSSDSSDFGRMLENYLPGKVKQGGKGGAGEQSGAGGKKAAEHPRNWKIDASIDLHGMTAAEARSALAGFFDRVVKQNRRKVLIVHGKGLHSRGEPVLRRTVLEFLDAHPRAGMRGTADRTMGGSGAIWVVVK